MKKILGSFLVFAIFLFAKEYEIDISKKEAFVKEPIFLSLKLFEKDKSDIVWVKFEPKKSKSYEVHLLQKLSNKDGYENRFLLFPLKSGQIEIDFNLLIKKASNKEIFENILGTGDEQTTMVEGKVYKYSIKPLILNIKPIKADLFGKFSLDLKVDKKALKDFEPLYATLTLKGEGYPPDFISSLKTEPKVKILKDKPQKDIRYTKNGAKIFYVFRYALISDRSYKILPIKLKEFDYEDFKILETPSFEINVSKEKNLLDKTTYPPKIKPVFDYFANFIQYFVIFLSGSIFGILLFLLIKGRFKEELKILLAKDEKELLKILILNYPEKFEDIKKLLDEKISKNKKINLWRIKRKILKEKRR